MVEVLFVMVEFVPVASESTNTVQSNVVFISEIAVKLKFGELVEEKLLSVGVLSVIGFMAASTIETNTNKTGSKHQYLEWFVTVSYYYSCF
jgi:hypothetical protein